MMHGYGVGLFGGLGIIFMILFWVGIIALGIWLLSNIFPKISSSQAGSGPAAGGSSETALDIAKKRYARGEISKEEYETLRRDLEA